MSEGLGPEARALLDAARGGMAPDAAAVRRMRGQIDVAMTRAAVKAASASKLGLGAKLAGVALAVVAAGSVAYVGNADERGSGVAVTRVREADAVVTPPRSVETPTAATKIAPAVEAGAPIAPGTQARAPIAPALKAPTEARAPIAPALKAPVEARAPIAPTASAALPRTQAAASPPHAMISEPPPAGRASLTREVELVDLAMAALRRGEPRTALRTVAVHASETAGRGQLAEDAAAIEVEALCQLRDPAVADKLAAFDHRFPRSAQRARLTAACR